MAETIYADQVTNISIHGGVVRLELATMDQLPKTKDEQIRFKVSHHLVLPLDAFVKAFEIQQAVMNKLLQDGVLTKRNPDVVTEPARQIETKAREGKAGKGDRTARSG